MTAPPDSPDAPRPSPEPTVDASPPSDAPPSIASQRTGAPSVDAPRTDAGTVVAQRTDAPFADAPRADAPFGDAPRTDALSVAAPVPPARALLATAVRTWLRYVVPLTVLSAIAFAPLAILVRQLRVPTTLAEAIATQGVGWAIVGTAWLSQLVLVGGAAALTGPRRSQTAALGAGLLRLLGAIVPCLAAAAAILLGGLAFVLPGVALLVLLVLTGASPARGLPDALRDSIAVARTRLPAVFTLTIAMLALDALVGVIVYYATIPRFARPPTPDQLAAARTFARTIVIALVAVSPLPATLLATLRRQADFSSHEAGSRDLAA